MKLYATTKSNRAMKGQGGDWLKIIIRNEKQHCIGYINITPETENKRAKIDIDMLEVADISVNKIVKIYTDDDIKGKQQKDEICEGCGELILENQSRVDNRHSTCI